MPIDNDGRLVGHARYDAVNPGHPPAHTPGRSGDLLLDRAAFQIRVARTADRRQQSSALVKRMYSARGYKTTHDEQAVRMPARVTLQACNGDDVFGTVDVSLESETGLAADALYASEINHYRVKDARVVEVTRLAVDPQFGSKELLGALFHTAYIFLGPVWKSSDLFVEVHPRHAAFYRRMLNFHVAGERKFCPRVDAPAVLLHIETSDMGKRAALYGGGQRKAQSLYPYFCSPEKTLEIIERIFALGHGNPESNTKQLPATAPLAGFS